MTEILDTAPDLLAPTDTFPRRHIGPRDADVQAMLDDIGFKTLDDLTGTVVPRSIQLGRKLELPAARGEHRLLADLRTIAARNEVRRSFIGLGYHECVTPPVIQRNVLENPGWYTQYTPYQAELAQGRLELLLHFQTMIAELTGLPMANASLLDEGTAAAEAMTMCRAAARGKKHGFFVDENCHPQTIAVVQGRAKPLDVPIVVGDPREVDFEAADLFGVLVQYPDTHGRVLDYGPMAEAAHAAGTLVVAACDLLALTMLRPPGEFGADIAIGTSQRFGVPLGYGGPHAAFLATGDKYKRQIPGRIVGVSKDDTGRPAFRLALQTREQHIRRDKATSNICTAQALLAIMAALYGVYHGPQGLRRIAARVHALTRTLAEGLRRYGHTLDDEPFFDTLRVTPEGLTAEAIHRRADERGINLRHYDDGRVGVALNEATDVDDLADLFDVFQPEQASPIEPGDVAGAVAGDHAAPHARTSDYLTHEVFARYHSEHEMLRYLQRLQSKELSLTHSMIPLGSCTMKLNATTELMPITWPEFCNLHPFAPAEQAEGYATLFEQLETWLSEITGFPAMSLQPNAGAQGEYAGLLAIRGYHDSRGDQARDVCLIPSSAHGTNPASAVMAGMRVVIVNCLANGSVDVEDLRAKATQHADQLAALMITYPSTHGVFEDEIQDVCAIVHENGGQVYLDGANMNAQVGLCRPGDFGADVCHLNLHKTFCIPHGGGGPGMGPIGVAAHLAPFVPGHPLSKAHGTFTIDPVSAAPYGSPGILPIPWTYIALMGAAGLKRASQVAILNANYMARQLGKHYDILYRGRDGLVAHEFILDTRPFKESAGISVDDIAKRLMDFGIHAPTMSFPVSGTLMVEPTESESREELDRFCEAMITIREEIRAVEEGRADREDNALRRAPHTAEAVGSDNWDRAYGREQAAWPLRWVRDGKFWPPVGRIDNAFGDRNLVCTCDPIEVYR